MDASFAVGAASIVGAALFYCAGYLSRSLRGGGARPADGAPALSPTATGAPAPPPVAPPPAAIAAPPSEALAKVSLAGASDADAAPESEMGTNLDELLKEIADTGKVSALVVADELGLLVASSGDPAGHEPLAVITSSIGELCGKARSELRLAPVQSLRMIDQNGGVLSCRFFAHGAQTLAVTALSRSGDDASGDIERALGRLTKIIEQHNAPHAVRPGRS